MCCMDRMCYLVFVFYMVSLISCANPSGENSQEKKTTAEDSPEKSLPKKLSDGEAIYKKHCAACHQMDGSGVIGQFPPLTNTKWVNGDKEDLIYIMLNGLTGELKVKGVVYNSIMAPYDFMSDQQIADVLSYVRKEFGTGAGPVTKAEVAKVRND